MQDAPYRSTVLEPIGKLCSYWPEINNAVSKRHKKVSAMACMGRTTTDPCCSYSTTMLLDQRLAS